MRPTVHDIEANKPKRILFIEVPVCETRSRKTRAQKKKGFEKMTMTSIPIPLIQGTEDGTMLIPILVLKDFNCNERYELWRNRCKFEIKNNIRPIAACGKQLEMEAFRIE